MIRKFKNKKNGRIYRVLIENAIDVTNKAEGPTKMVVYCNEDDYQNKDKYVTYVRIAEEFYNKFEEIKECVKSTQ